jgi:hypothetical protein
MKGRAALMPNNAKSLAEWREPSGLTCIKFAGKHRTARAVPLGNWISVAIPIDRRSPMGTIVVSVSHRKAH